MNPFDQPTQPTEAHRKLWTALYNLAHREIFEDYAESSEGPATQLIADSEARAVEVAFPDSGDDSLYNVRRLRAELTAAKAEASHYMAVAQKTTDELIFFRADSLKAHQMTCAAALERDAEREKVRVLREALENLIDEQNGAPLCTREEEWKEAMNGAEAALAATEAAK
jgi:hypothetical protein